VVVSGYAPLNVVGYGKMNMGHVGSPTLYVSSYFGVFLLCYHRDLVFTGR
jgi:hypothetical protein